MQRLTEVVKHLLIINVLFFIAKLTLQSYPFNLDSLALHFPGAPEFQPYQLVTHMFMHGGVMHILFNMFALWMFGSAVETVWGPKKFLFFYLTAGFGAALFSIGIDYYNYHTLMSSLAEMNLSGNAINQIMSMDIYSIRTNNDLFKELTPILTDNQLALSQRHVQELYDLGGFGHKSMLGASGAIMGVLVAFGMLFPNAELMLIFLPIPIKAKYFIPAIVGMDIISGITGNPILPFSPSNIAYWAHVGGALAGFLLVLYFKKTQFDGNRWN